MNGEAISIRVENAFYATTDYETDVPEISDSNFEYAGTLADGK
jgi:hypothetical protein